MTSGGVGGPFMGSRGRGGIAGGHRRSSWYAEQWLSSGRGSHAVRDTAGGHAAWPTAPGAATRRDIDDKLGFHVSLASSARAHVRWRGPLDGDVSCDAAWDTMLACGCPPGPTAT